MFLHFSYFLFIKYLLIHNKVIYIIFKMVGF